jgi:hypothetical protein
MLIAPIIASPRRVFWFRDRLGDAVNDLVQPKMPMSKAA